MKISSRFTVAIHILSVLAIQKDVLCTSEFIAGSVNTNPVVIRRITSMLKKAGLINVTSGTGGASINKPLNDITLLEIYKAVNVVDEGGIFQFNENPNPDCPIGKNIQSLLELVLFKAQDAMENVLSSVTLENLIKDLNNKINNEI
ncbi:DNA-binding IscR family transcriptional regulator [Clostridium saccharoperbutylacetonicum]|uniref:Rrf2 family protein n=1 Tax=Clostridium saccharoperbutylacetonicum N1-4(HMT) TaxID=931276 RepID=M1MCD5_9CLOT|nr:Rrf2 family transcriptional regulator [Clostridium saccharoperbutylacetonicum]AGF55579.1 Rrf2 family protein [Clostridium saccharoperbutylacetonicum N1-4(HMT)]NRT63700.1 DNA-binding IscR family transcriptional regulator [Clostridium saccharoperbutylacetonicum]NSB27063.1 DNA-binding IscR family transcriptional regulator [Clostridium saccharoperbutylacetonicum]NSB40548.1 DNA-binding IscR family transcriptional regulator [Clostridium saccharoperbutylacetonicum]